VSLVQWVAGCGYVGEIYRELTLMTCLADINKSIHRLLYHGVNNRNLLAIYPNAPAAWGSTQAPGSILGEILYSLGNYIDHLTTNTLTSSYGRLAAPEIARTLSQEQLQRIVAKRFQVLAWRTMALSPLPSREQSPQEKEREEHLAFLCALLLARSDDSRIWKAEEGKVVIDRLRSCFSLFAQFLDSRRGLADLLSRALCDPFDERAIGQELQTLQLPRMTGCSLPAVLGTFKRRPFPALMAVIHDLYARRSHLSPQALARRCRVVRLLADGWVLPLNLTNEESSVTWEEFSAEGERLDEKRHLLVVRILALLAHWQLHMDRILGKYLDTSPVLSDRARRTIRWTLTTPVNILDHPRRIQGVPWHLSKSYLKKGVHNLFMRWLVDHGVIVGPRGQGAAPAADPGVEVPETVCRGKAVERPAVTQGSESRPQVPPLAPKCAPEKCEGYRGFLHVVTRYLEGKSKTRRHGADVRAWAEKIPMPSTGELVREIWSVFPREIDREIATLRDLCLRHLMSWEACVSLRAPFILLLHLNCLSLTTIAVQLRMPRKRVRNHPLFRAYRRRVAPAAERLCTRAFGKGKISGKKLSPRHLAHYTRDRTATVGLLDFPECCNLAGLATLQEGEGSDLREAFLRRWQLGEILFRLMNSRAGWWLEDILVKVRNAPAASLEFDLDAPQVRGLLSSSHIPSLGRVRLELTFDAPPHDLVPSALFAYRVQSVRFELPQGTHKGGTDHGTT
jgi:hypothetical protein